MTTQSAPTVAKLAFGALLSRVRANSGRSRNDVADELEVDVSTYGRWESGKYAPKPISVAAIAAAVRATPEEKNQMKTLAMESQRRGLFQGRNVPPHLRAFYEIEASSIRTWSLELEHIPGPLQTPEYHLLVQEYQLPTEPGYAETLRELRPKRQEIMFRRPDAPELLFLIGSAAMRYLDDHPAIKDDQIELLREANALAHAEVRVVTGMHAGMLSSFTIFTPPEATGARPFVHTETLEGDRFIEGAVVSRFGAAVSRIREEQSQNLEDYLK
jgi:transcriptional regulator with XRE-family HTH domain